MSNEIAASTSSVSDAAIMAEPLSAHPLRLAMVSWMVAGIRTHYENVCQVTLATPGVAALRIEVYPWHEGGAIERLKVLPKRMRSTLRTFASTGPLYRHGAIDVVWSQVPNPTALFLYTVGAMRQVPVVIDTDCTPRLLASFGAHYAEQIAGPMLKRRMVEVAWRAVTHRSAAIVAWSEWAARSFVKDYGVLREHIRVIPPGVNVFAWAPPVEPRQRHERVRVLFVGGDFERKGGDLLVDVWQRHFADQCELHIVTKDQVESRPGIFVYRDFAPNDPALRQLYHHCDMLVLPTRGDCFSLASIEAMATGLPVITSAVGGIPEIVEEGTTGYLVAPNDGAALRRAMAELIEDAALRARMGAAGRQAVVARFDATHNTRRLLEMLRQVALKKRL